MRSRSLLNKFAMELFAPNPAASRRALRGTNNDEKRSAYDFGLKAEKIAAWYLRAKGYRILVERYRNHYGEIDLVASRGNTLVAIEVKARRNFAECEISVPPAKQLRIARAMEALLAGYGAIPGLERLREHDIRFDVVWVVRGFLPRHVQDAWRM